MSRVLHVPAARLAIVLLLGLLSGCVTTVEGGFKADREEEVESRVQAASQYLAKGNTEQAIVHLKRALELDPKAATVHDTLARVFWQTGEYELADQHFQRALAAEPDFSRGRNNYAAFLYSRGQIDEAIAQFERVVADTLYEKRAEAFTNLGKAYLTKGRTDKAEESFTRAVKMDRRNSMALFELAELYHAQGDFDRAQRYYDQFRNVTSRPSARSLLLGIKLARRSGDKDAEASYALQLKGLFPSSDEYREYLALSSGS